MVATQSVARVIHWASVGVTAAVPKWFFDRR
jgi:hypothetical protein